MARALIYFPDHRNALEAIGQVGLVMRGRRKAHSIAADHSQQGAAAVEFALLVPIVFLLLFGMIDYGFWFNDSLNVRHGVKESAREAVVNNFSCPTSPPPASNMAKVACQTNSRISPLTGQSYTKVVVPAGGWKREAPLLVCSMVKADVLIGLVPLPSDGLIRSKTRMSIETVVPSQVETSYEDTPPSGADWSWCT
jgi:hypothetical protein